MKVRILAFLGAALLLSACSAQEVVQQAEVIEEAIDQAEDRIEDQLEETLDPTAGHDHSLEGVTLLLPDEAEDIAVAHAGYSSKQVSKLKNRFEAKHEGNIYVVKFQADGKQYHYTIHAETGDILEFEVDGAVSSSAITDTKIPREQAKSVALEHAGFAEDQVSFLYVTFDYDDGVPEYEVEFVANGLEYEYTIHAETGELLSFETDD